MFLNVAEKAEKTSQCDKIHLVIGRIRLDVFAVSQAVLDAESYY